LQSWGYASLTPGYGRFGLRPKATVGKPNAKGDGRQAKRQRRRSASQTPKATVGKPNAKVILETFLFSMQPFLDQLPREPHTMDPTPLAEQAQALANDLLVWVGFGSIVGLVAKGIMPGRDPGGTVATLAMGIGGSVIGCGVLAYFYDGPRVTPISPLGFCVATGGAFTLLFFYRLLGGYFFVEGEAPARAARPRRRRRPRQAAYDLYED
jgi:uncharacterized membrane protein YeaQ/YmgE (transglycosylase-associated protein family)